MSRLACEPTKNDCRASGNRRGMACTEPLRSIIKVLCPRHAPQTRLDGPGVSRLFVPAERTYSRSSLPSWTFAAKANLARRGAAKLGPDIIKPCALRVSASREVLSGRKDLQKCPAVLPVFGTFDESSLPRIVKDVRVNLFILLITARPMIEPFILPESTVWQLDKLSGLMPGSAFEIFERFLQGGFQNTHEEMNVVRHNHESINDPPTCPDPMFNRLNDHLSDRRICKKQILLAGIEPRLHLTEDRARQQKAGLVSFSSRLTGEFLGEQSNSFFSGSRNCTCQVNSNELPTILDFPVRQPASPEPNCLWFSEHSWILLIKARSVRQVGPTCRAGLSPQGEPCATR